MFFEVAARCVEEVPHTVIVSKLTVWPCAVPRVFGSGFCRLPTVSACHRECMSATWIFKVDLSKAGVQGGCQSWWGLGQPHDRRSSGCKKTEMHEHRVKINMQFTEFELSVFSQ